ncbi:hypothetical protein WG66_011276, partial [Moniliophthora roreri]
TDLSADQFSLLFASWLFLSLASCCLHKGPTPTLYIIAGDSKSSWSEAQLVLYSTPRVNRCSNWEPVKSMWHTEVRIPSYSALCEPEPWLMSM